MPSERTQRRIEATLDEAEAAFSQRGWALVAELARAILAMDPDNEDAPPLLRAAETNLGASAAAGTSVGNEPVVAAAPAASALPASFAGGRYHVRKFLGEGGFSTGLQRSSVQTR